MVMADVTDPRNPVPPARCAKIAHSQGDHHCALLRGYARGPLPPRQAIFLMGAANLAYELRLRSRRLFLLPFGLHSYLQPCHRIRTRQGQPPQVLGCEICPYLPRLPAQHAVRWICGIRLLPQADPHHRLHRRPPDAPVLVRPHGQLLPRCCMVAFSRDVLLPRLPLRLHASAPRNSRQERPGRLRLLAARNDPSAALRHLRS